MLALIGPVGLRQDDAAALAQPADRADPDGARRGGRITLDGEDVDALEVTQLRRRVSMVFQQPNPFPMSDLRQRRLRAARAGLAGGAEASCAPPVIDALQRAGLYDEVADNLDHPALRLSGGQQQRLCIARSLAVAARGAAARRAVLGARPALDRGDRGADRASCATRSRS